MTDDFIGLFLKVLTSWEVLAVTIAIVVYLFLVFYVARLNRKPRAPRRAKKPKIVPAPQAAGPAIEDDLED